MLHKDYPIFTLPPGEWLCDFVCTLDRHSWQQRSEKTAPPPAWLTINQLGCLPSTGELGPGMGVGIFIILPHTLVSSEGLGLSSQSQTVSASSD